MVDMIEDIAQRAEVHGVLCDVSDAARLEPAFQEALAVTGHCDLFLYNAGVMHHGDGVTTRYAHLSAAALRDDDGVRIPRPLPMTAPGPMTI